MAEQREESTIGSYLAAGGVAALFVTVAEVFLSDGPGNFRFALISAATFLLPLGLTVGLALWGLFRLTSRLPALRRMLTSGPSPDSPVAAAAPFLLFFLPLLLLFAAPLLLAVSGLLGNLVGAEIIRTVGTGGAAAAIAAAIGAAGLTAALLVSVLQRLGRMPRPTPLLFWTVAFPRHGAWPLISCCWILPTLWGRPPCFCQAQPWWFSQSPRCSSAGGLNA